jgi:hypothetical protein
MGCKRPSFDSKGNLDINLYDLDESGRLRYFYHSPSFWIQAVRLTASLHWLDTPCEALRTRRLGSSLLGRFPSQANPSIAFGAVK